jgi:phosphatidylinositol 4-kinase
VVSAPSTAQKAEGGMQDVGDRAARLKMLKTNYFRCETQFMYALQSISARLMQVPKDARLASLRVELALLNKDLPAEVDIPLLLPTDTKGSSARHHRIVRIAPAEATVLNSAEKAPFLLLIEYLREDIDFNVDSRDNKEIMASATDRRYIFDMAYLHKQHNKQQERGRSRHIRATSSTPSLGPKLSDEFYPETGLPISSVADVPIEEKDMGDIVSLPYYEGIFDFDRRLVGDREGAI